MSIGYVVCTDDGLFDIDANRVLENVFAGQPVTAIADCVGGYLIVVDGSEVWRCTEERAKRIGSGELRLNCVAGIGDTVFAGTEDARLVQFRLSRNPA